jgi:hypothetical protein
MALLGAGYVIANLAAPSFDPGNPRLLIKSGDSTAKSLSTAPPDSTPVSVAEAPPPAAANVSEGKTTGLTPPPAPRQRTTVSKPIVDSTAAKVLPPSPNVIQPGSLATTPATKAETSVSPPFDSSALRAAVNTVPLATPARPPAIVAPAVDEQAEVRSLILAFARALAASDLAAARRLYPGMPNEQREGFEALWKQGTLTPRWTVSDISVDGNSATARIQGTNVVTLRRGPASEQPVALRARLERRGAEWRLVSLIN